MSPEFHFLALRHVWILSPIIQLIIMCVLFIVSGLIQYRVYKHTGRFSFNYPPNTFLGFAPIYEEAIFRGFLFAALIPLYGITWSVVITSILFGVIHLRSIIFMPPKKVAWQVAYTGLILGPLFAWLTLLTGTIWIAVIMHFINNLFSFILDKDSMALFWKPKN